MHDREKVLKIASVYTAVILGAGFASGQELISFFVRFGLKGFVGVSIACVIFTLVAYSVLNICKKERINNYDEFINYLFGKRLGKLMMGVTAVFFFVLFATMLAAAGATVKEVFSLNFTVGVMLVGLVCVVVFMNGIEAITEINVIIAPIMVVGGIFIGIYTFIFEIKETFLQNVIASSNNWIIMAIIYVGYNIITAASVLVTLNALVTRKRIAVFGSVISGLSMLILAVSIMLPLYLRFDQVFGLEIPMLGILHEYGDLIRYFYLIILLCAIFTTAVANGFVFIEWVSGKFERKLAVTIVVTVFAVVFSHIGFSGFVNVVYPIFGVVGVIQVFSIIVKGLNN